MRFFILFLILLALPFYDLRFVITVSDDMTAIARAIIDLSDGENHEPISLMTIATHEMTIPKLSFTDLMISIYSSSPIPSSQSADMP